MVKFSIEMAAILNSQVSKQDIAPFSLAQRLFQLDFILTRVIKIQMTWGCSQSFKDSEYVWRHII